MKRRLKHGVQLTRPAVARLLGISTSRVQQLEQRAIDKLRRSRVLQDVARELGIVVK